jgi:hypothetical protein
MHEHSCGKWIQVSWPTATCAIWRSKILQHIEVTCATFSTYVWNTWKCDVHLKNRWNIWKRCLQHAFIFIATCATSGFSFTTCITNIDNMRIKHWEHSIHKLATCAFCKTWWCAREMGASQPAPAMVEKLQQRYKEAPPAPYDAARPPLPHCGRVAAWQRSSSPHAWCSRVPRRVARPSPWQSRGAYPGGRRAARARAHTPWEVGPPPPAV